MRTLMICTPPHNFSGDQLEKNKMGGACSAERRGVYRILVGKPEVKRPFGRPRCRWEDNIKTDLKEVGCAGVDWIDVSEDRDTWWTFVNAVMNIGVPLIAGNLLTS
jgi:hypothetical protein